MLKKNFHYKCYRRCLFVQNELANRTISPEKELYLNQCKQKHDTDHVLQYRELRALYLAYNSTTSTKFKQEI